MSNVGLICASVKCQNKNVVVDNVYLIRCSVEFDLVRLFHYA